MKVTIVDADGRSITFGDAVGVIIAGDDGQVYAVAAPKDDGAVIGTTKQEIVQLSRRIPNCDVKTGAEKTEQGETDAV